MAPSNIGYSLRECGHHFRRNWTTVLGAVVTIFLSLFIIGLFVLGSVMIDNMVGSVEDTVTIQAFLADDADQSAVTAFQTKVQGWDNVESVIYKDKDQALEEYRTSMSNRNAADAVAALDGENPCRPPWSSSCPTRSRWRTPPRKIIADTDFQSICDDADNPAGDVNYGRQTVERLFSVANYIRIAAVVLVALLTFVAFVFINNTIRLAITARRRDRHHEARRRLQRLHPRALPHGGHAGGPYRRASGHWRAGRRQQRPSGQAVRHPELPLV